MQTPRPESPLLHHQPWALRWNGPGAFTWPFLTGKNRLGSSGSFLVFTAALLVAFRVMAACPDGNSGDLQVTAASLRRTC